MLIKELLSILFMLAGFFFFLTATLGLLRLPDFFSRLHATGKGDTLAVLLSLLGLAIYLECFYNLVCLLDVCAI